MDLVLSHPFIVDKGIRNIYSGLHTHYGFGPRSCEDSEKSVKRDIHHVHAMEKFRRSQMEYLPHFQTSLPRAPAYNVASRREIRRIVARLYTPAKTSRKFSPRRPVSEKETEIKKCGSARRIKSAQACTRSIIFIPSARSSRRRGTSKSVSESNSETTNSERKDTSSSDKTDVPSLDLSKLNHNKSYRPMYRSKSAGMSRNPGKFTFNSTSQKSLDSYQPKRESLFQMIQDLG